VEGQGTPDFRLGSELAGYRIEAAIGRGGMSRVYRAEHLRLGRLVALKLLGPDLAADPVFRARFEREWRIAAALRHPHIVPIYDAGDEDGVLYIAMLLVEGGDLSALLRERGAMDPDRALDVLAQVASALDAAHEQHLIHRDLKPSNVLLATGRAADRSDHAYLADFGLMRSIATNSELTLTGSYLGTPGYSSPEQIAGHAIDTRADVYALGCMLFECLTGSVPFPRDTEMAAIAAHLTEPPPSAHAMRPDLPAAIDSVLARGLAKTPEGRYSTAPELIDAAKAAFASSAATVALAPAVVPGFPPSPPGTNADIPDTDTRVDAPKRPRSSKPRRPFARAAPLGIILAVPLVLGGAILAGLASGLLGAPSSTVGETALPSASAAALASTVASPSSNAYFAGATADEQYLIQRVPAAFAPDCRRYKPQGDSEIPAGVAGVTCPVNGPDVAGALYFRFASGDAMHQWWQLRMRAQKLQPDSGGCSGGRTGETSYTGGRLLCFVSSSIGHLRWIDDGALIVGLVDGRAARLPAIVQWWLDSHAIQGVRADPLFRPVEQGLVADAPPDVATSCIPYRIVAAGDTVVKGSAGAIDCLVETKLVEDVGYFEFPTLAKMQAWWRDRMTTLKIDVDSGGCVDGTPGETDTGHGRIACYRSAAGVARIRWIDDTRLVYGAVNGVTGNLASLFEWWDSRH
jgi:serine/threonine-protein kinase